MLARMIVDDGASLGGRERSTALRGKGRWCRAEAKIEICWHDRKRKVEMLLSTPILVPIENHRYPTATVEDPLVGPPAAADHGVRFEIEQNGVLGPSSRGWIFSVFHGVDYFFYGYLSAA